MSSNGSSGDNGNMSQSLSESDRRRFTRIDFATSIEIVIGSNVIFPDPVFNLSVGGLKAHASESLDSGVTVVVRIHFDGVGEGGVFIEAQGEVIRSIASSADGYDVAIRFTEMSDDSYHHLRKLVWYNSEDPDRVEKEL